MQSQTSYRPKTVWYNGSPFNEKIISDLNVQLRKAKDLKANRISATVNMLTTTFPNNTHKTILTLANYLVNSLEPKSKPLEDNIYFKQYLRIARDKQSLILPSMTLVQVESAFNELMKTVN